jgi:DNA-binding NarL/FixJ family response regulator
MVPRILLVDDHRPFRARIAGLLKGSCDVCGEAENGQEAIDKVLELTPDLVLMDLSMPVMGGTAAARQIRRISPATKIVFLSMPDSETVVELARLAGADACISKRCAATELLEAIASALRVPSPSSFAREVGTRKTTKLRLLDPT